MPEPAIIAAPTATKLPPEARGGVLVTGSHGGLVGGMPSMALRAEGFAAAFNDAGFGIEQAGIGRLAALGAAVGQKAESVLRAWTRIK